MEATNEVKRTVIRPNTANMVKGPGGSFHKDDFIGNVLAGLTVDQVLAVGAEMGIEIDKYAHLNRGQQRMTVGNALRKLANNGDGDDAARIEDAALAYHEENEAAKAEKAAAKEAAKAEKAAAKAEKVAAKAAKKAKLADSPNGEGSVE